MRSSSWAINQSGSCSLNFTFCFFHEFRKRSIRFFHAPLLGTTRIPEYKCANVFQMCQYAHLHLRCTPTAQCSSKGTRFTKGSKQLMFMGFFISQHSKNSSLQRIPQTESGKAQLIQKKSSKTFLELVKKSVSRTGAPTWSSPEVEALLFIKKKLFRENLLKENDLVLQQLRFYKEINGNGNEFPRKKKF